jgi:hypothetical protein
LPTTKGTIFDQIIINYISVFSSYIHLASFLSESNIGTQGAVIYHYPHAFTTNVYSVIHVIPIADEVILVLMITAPLTFSLTHCKFQHHHYTRLWNLKYGIPYLLLEALPMAGHTECKTIHSEIRTVLD